MKLQSKVLLILAGIWLVICIVIYIDAKLILEKKYKKAEIAHAQKDVYRAQKAIDSILNALRLYTISFSQWDEAYDFSTTKNQRFIKSNFVPGTFTSSKINFFMFYNSKGAFYYGKAYDLIKNDYMPIPTSLLSYLQKHPKLVTPKDVSARNTGILQIPEGLVIFSSMPVLTSDGKGPIQSTLFMGYYLTEKFIIDLSQTVELKLKMYPLPLATNDKQVHTAFQSLLHEKGPYIASKNQNMNEGFSIINDINNRPIALLRIDLPREIYYEGIMTINHCLAVVVILGILILITMWYLLKMLVLNRVISVSKQVIDINSSAQFYKRINTSGNDEISQMVCSLNSMLEVIELTQDQLKHRISRRTIDLEKLSRLNRNLFAEINKQKSVETKLREDEKILRQMAYYDTLTGLPNRTFFNELLLNALNQAEHANQKVAVLFLDIDKFKKINDTYGHEFGNKLLKEVASRFKGSIKDTDVAARVAGDEFILFITQISQREQLDKIIERLFVQLTLPMKFNHVQISPTFSIGASLYPDDSKTISELINQADLAMYYAKKREGNIYYYFSTIENSKATPVPY